MKNGEIFRQVMSSLSLRLKSQCALRFLGPEGHLYAAGRFKAILGKSII